ncbi:MAG: sulfatase [Acidobacteriota bacterium]
MARLLNSFLRGFGDNEDSRTTVSGGILSGLFIAGAYAALEMLLTGPLNALIHPERTIGSWYLSAVCLYFGLYLLSGAIAGAAVGSVLSLAKRPAHHCNLILSAMLMALFAVNALTWQRTVFSSPFLVVVFPTIVWLLAGLLAERRDASRAFAASPWFTAILVLGPVWLSRELLLDQALAVRLLASGSLVAVLFLAALAARDNPGVLRLAGLRPHAALTALVFLSSYVMLLGMEETPVAAMRKPAATGRPNLILISLDTTRADHLSVYGYSRRTSPNLERFAAQATLYRNAYSNGDFTLPSHASMLTGRYPSQHGAVGDMKGFHPISPGVPTLPELLRKSGYFTAAVVANYAFLTPEYGFNRGFDRMVMPHPIVVAATESGYQLRTGLCALTLPWLWTDAIRTYAYSDDIARMGESEIGRSNGRPFFLFMNLMDSHRPWVSRGRFRAMFPHYDQSSIHLDAREDFSEILRGTRFVTADEREKMHAAYDGGIAYMDDALGRLLERLRKAAWYDQSLIIITADHGDLFGRNQLIDHGNSLNQGATRVPFLVKFPGQTTARVEDSPVSLVDAFSTIAAVGGVPATPQDAGVNLSSNDPGDERAIILESYPVRHFAKENPRLMRMERAVVQGRWKLIESNRGRRDLYDIAADPAETKNLWSARMDVAEQLERKMREWKTTAGSARTQSALPVQDPKRLQKLKALGYAQ